MKRQLLEDLRCPFSSDPLQLANGDSNGDIESAELICAGCGRGWEVRRRVPRLVPADLAEQQRRTAAAFGFEWQYFAEMHPEYEAQFLDWIHPISRGFFQGKRVLDAGCGTGRHAYYAAQYGASEVVGLDLSDAVETASRVLSRFENVEVVQGDLLRPPLRTAAEGGGFDLVYSVGVLHHLPDPYEGFRSLLRLVRPGGTIAVWVYGYENNGFVRNVIEPLRRVTTMVVYSPLAGTAVGDALPLNQYMASVANFSFRQNYSIVFDQLVAPTAAYIKGPELRRWFDENELEDVVVSQRHGNSWRGQGRMPT